MLNLFALEIYICYALEICISSYDLQDELVPEDKAKIGLHRIHFLQRREFFRYFPMHVFLFRLGSVYSTCEL